MNHVSFRSSTLIYRIAPTYMYVAMNPSMISILLKFWSTTMAFGIRIETWVFTSFTLSIIRTGVIEVFLLSRSRVVASLLCNYWNQYLKPFCRFCQILISAPTLTHRKYMVWLDFLLGILSYNTLWCLLDGCCGACGEINIDSNSMNHWQKICITWQLIICS